MMMINVPWHFKVDACAKGGKKKHVAGTIIHQDHYSQASTGWLVITQI